MNMYLIAVGERLDFWVNEGFTNYQKRLSQEYKLHLITIPTSKRSKSTSVAHCLMEEEKKILAAIPKYSRIVALDEKGIMWSTQELAKTLAKWQLERQDVSFIIGGPDGLSAGCLQRANHRWSLSALTFPHGLVRIIVAEQIYRAWSLLKGHPYHRD